MATPTAGRRRAVATTRVWLAALLGLACWLAAGIGMLTSLGSAATWNAPGSTTVTLSDGTWGIFELVPDSQVQSVWPGDFGAYRTIDWESVEVRDGSGARVATECGYCAQAPMATPVDFALYNLIATFDAAPGGPFLVSVTSGDGSQVAVANPQQSMTATMSWALPVGLFGLILLVFAVTGAVRYRRSRGDFSGPSVDAAPAGWYPNPYLPGTDSQMWWDGKQWTSHWR